MPAEGRVENQNEPKRPPLLWPFWFVLVFNSINYKKSDPPSAENRVSHRNVRVFQILFVQYFSKMSFSNIHAFSGAAFKQERLSQLCKEFGSCSNHTLNLVLQLYQSELVNDEIDISALTTEVCRNLDQLDSEEGGSRLKIFKS